VRLALWVALFAVALAGVSVSAQYSRVSSQLPALDTEDDLRVQLKLPPRAANPGAKASADAPFERLPRDLIAAHISQLGCPGFFASGREDGLPWLWRLLSGLWGVELPGDGRCERRLALRIAASTGARVGAPQVVAANKIHRLLQRHELVAYALGAARFEAGVVGVAAAARALFRKELEALDLSEIAELMLTLPPYEFYEELKTCRNASLIRQSRDYVLALLVTHSLIASDRASAAQVQPVACTRN
jgi:hypothetical protein